MKDPSRLLRYRDSIYAMDLLICSIAYLDFFSFLKDNPQTFDEICAKLKIASRPADVMLSLFLAMELIEKDGTSYKLTDISHESLVNNSSTSLVPYYASLKNRPQCKEFLDVLKTGKPAGWSSKKDGKSWLEAMRDNQFADSFTTAMDSRGMFLAKKLVEKIDLSNYSSLLDIAGGSGVYACEISRKYKNLNTTVLEITPVDKAAKRSIKAKRMSSRVSVISANMFDEIPEGYDAHLFANVFHDWDIDSVRKLAENSFESLRSNGSIIIFDAHLNKEKNGPLSVAEYSCLIMHSTVGRCYSIKEIDDILQKAGFTEIKITEIAADKTIIIGNKKMREI
jgi:hypothetical protein